MRVLITGAGGLLGGRLAECLAARFDVVAGFHHAPPPASLPSLPLDLTCGCPLLETVRGVRVDAIVHSAALADADRCERDPALARALNVEAARVLARAARELDVPLVALSTDLVFDGARAPYRDGHTPQATLTYGITKLAGEEAILSELPAAAVARVALVTGCGYGPRATATEAIAWRLRAGEPVRLFTDQFRTPVDADSVADAVARLLLQGARGRFHLGGDERVSRHALGLRVAQVLGLDPAGIEAGRAGDLPQHALRPADVSLDSSRARQELGWVPQPLDTSIRAGRPMRPIPPP